MIITLLQQMILCDYTIVVSRNLTFIIFIADGNFMRRYRPKVLNRDIKIFFVMENTIHTNTSLTANVSFCTERGTPNTSAPIRNW